MDDNPYIFYYKKPKLKNTLYLDRDGVLNEVVMRGEELSSPRLIDELNIKVSLLDSSEKSTKIERSNEAEDLHREWLTLLSQQQPLELKRENLVNKLKILCDENSGIENTCSWKREPIKKIKKSDLLEVDKDIVNKYLVKVNSTSSFVLNTFRAYKFK